LQISLVFSGVFVLCVVRYEQMFGLMDEIKLGREALDAQTAAWLEQVAEFDRSEQWRAAGYYSAAAALADVCRMDKGVASAAVKLARKLEKLPLVADAFAEGAISERHASVIATAATPERMAEFSNLEPEFVDVARKCPPKELVAVVGYVTDALDGDGGAGAEDRMFQRRRYKQSRTLDQALAVDGFLDPESAGIHESALKIARDRDEREAESRTPAQRNADAVTMIMRQWLELTGADTPDHVRRNFVFVVDLEETPGIGPELIAVARSERRRDGHLSEATLERIACDGNLSRVIMLGTSEVLDLGRTTRIASNAQFRALIARDRHCQAPGCKEPPTRCQAHHKWHWTRGGPTDLDNLELLCWHHHRQRHIEEANARARRPRADDHPRDNPSSQAVSNVPPTSAPDRARPD
jgi:hypothetical protein